MYSKILVLRFSEDVAQKPVVCHLARDFDLVFNILNANHVLLQNESIGSTWGRPTRILAPRIVRLGVTARF